MTIEEAIIYHLLNRVPALGPLVQGRIYADTLPQNPTYPAVVCSIDSTDADQTNDGPSGYVKIVLRIDVVAQKASDRRQIGDALTLALAGFRGSMGNDPVEIEGITRVGDSNSYDDDFETYQRTQDFEVQYIEPTA